MHSIIATRDTWLKREPAQSSALSDSDKTKCPVGTKLEVESYAPSPGGHWELQIDGERWYVFDAAAHGPASHWDCSWEKDGPSENDDAQVTSRNIERAQEAQAVLTPAGMDLQPGVSFDTLITPHFTYGEICLYEEERRFASAGSIRAAYELLIFLEKVRSHFNAPVRITSGHRPPTVNRRIGGATYSEHLFRAPGMGAVDVYVDGTSIHDFQDYCDRNWPHSVGYGAARGFVHLGIGRGRVRWPY